MYSHLTLYLSPSRAVNTLCWAKSSPVLYVSLSTTATYVFTCLSNSLFTNVTLCYNAPPAWTWFDDAVLLSSVPVSAIPAPYLHSRHDPFVSSPAAQYSCTSLSNYQRWPLPCSPFFPSVNILHHSFLVSVCSTFTYYTYNVTWHLIPFSSTLAHCV